MKTLKYFFGIILLLVFAAGCKKESNTDTSFVQTAASPGKLALTFDIAQDNSGLVTITPNGEGASSYNVYYGDTTTKPVTIQPGKSAQHKYGEGTFQVKVVARGLSGSTSEVTKPLTVSFKAPENLDFKIVVDPTNAYTVNVSASALYETVFKVYFGDVPNETPLTLVENASVSHTYTATGAYTIKVVALSGGAATAELTKVFTIFSPVLLPINFESASVNYTFTNFGGGAVTVINNPQPNGINTSTKVGQMIKNAGEVYGGSFISLGGSIDFSGSKIFKMKVFSPRVGAKVLLKVENATNTSLSYEKEVLTTVANSWENLSFDFSAINTANTYQHVVLIFDLGIMGDGSPNYTFLFDDITL